MRFPNLSSLFLLGKKSKDDDGSDYVYASFTVRTFAITVDMLLLFLLMAPVFGWISEFVFPDYYLNGGDNQAQNIMFALGNEKITTDVAMQKLEELGVFRKLGLDYFLQLFVSGVIIIFAWVKFNTTPGLAVFRAHVADATTGETPTLRQYVIRYIVGVIAIAPLMLGVLVMFFNARKMALHDWAANTVILRRKFRLRRSEDEYEDSADEDGENEAQER